MIGLVVVSHSRDLADAAVALARQMVTSGAGPAVAVAAGTADGGFGTDATAVADAITRVAGPDGVLVLADLGSAVMSAEMALELLDPDIAAVTRLSPAPLVEGLVAAVVTASGGADLDTVAAASDSAFVRPGPAENPSSDSDESGWETVEVTLTNEHGLHARPAARLVAVASGFDGEVTVTDLDSGQGPVSAASLSQVATLNAGKGHRLRLRARGAGAGAALAALQALAADGFEEQGEAAAEPTETPKPGGSGLDIAIGPAVLPAGPLDPSTYTAGDADTELRRWRGALSAAREGLSGLYRTAAHTIGRAKAGIVAAQLALLDDPALVARVEKAIADGTDAPAAWNHAADEVAARFTGLDDPYQRARAEDIHSVQRRLLAHLLARRDVTSAAATPARRGRCAVSAVVGAGAGPVVLVLPELDAATALAIDGSRVAGVVTVGGSPTGHGPLIARSRGIPVLTGGGEEVARIRPGSLVAFDARTHELAVDAGPETEQRYRDRLAERAAQRSAAAAQAREPATTTDGCRVVVRANVGSVREAEVAVDSGAEGSGLVRTEVLFGGWRQAPTVAQQVAEFRRVAAALGGAPMTVRTWDVGGDKPLPFLPHLFDPNPFLGRRGIRLFRDDPEPLVEQMQALCQVAAETPVRMMFPMVTTVEELTWLRELLTEAAERSGGVPDGLAVGVMVEVPAAALGVRRLAGGLDFVSIGTNDLAQYVLAAERGNAAVASLADAWHPSVLRLIHGVCAEAPAGVEVAVCGDLASEPDAVPLLLGLGVDELSVVPVQVPVVKDRVRRVSVSAARARAEEALAHAGSAADVRRLFSPG